MFVLQIAEAEADKIKKTYPPGKKNCIDVKVRNVGDENLN
jgi:hypothetical protein